MRSLILIPALALMAGAALAQEAPKAEDGGKRWGRRRRAAQINMLRAQPSQR